MNSSVLWRELLPKYWFEFAASDWDVVPPCCRRGIGVNAFDLNDAVGQPKLGPFQGTSMPEPQHIRENVSITDLDQNHVVPNMKPAIFRGYLVSSCLFRRPPFEVSSNVFNRRPRLPNLQPPRAAHRRPRQGPLSGTLSPRPGGPLQGPAAAGMARQESPAAHLP